MTDRHMLGLAKSGALRVVVLTALGAAFVAACGGGGTGDTGGSGGSGTDTGGSATGTGGSGTSTGGSATGTGGAGSSTGGAGGASSGGASTSSGGDGGFGGGGPGAGGGENPPSCPETMPGPEDACEGGFMAPTCTYGDQVCECGFGQDATWECSEATEEPECPEEAPEDGDECAAEQFCNFGGGDFCICDGETWNCP